MIGKNHDCDVLISDFELELLENGLDLVSLYVLFTEQY